MAKKKAQSEKQEIETKIKELRARLEQLNQIEAQDKSAKLYRRCFKYKNCYSCPNGPEDYWWMYGRVIYCDGTTIEMCTFQRDKDGKLEFDPARPRHYELSEGFIEIDEDEFDAAFEQFKKGIVKP